MTVVYSVFVASEIGGRWLPEFSGARLNGKFSKSGHFSATHEGCARRTLYSSRYR
jgi:hypothetical protein